MIPNLIRFVLTGPVVQPLTLLGVGGGVGFWFGVGDVGGAGQMLATAILAIAATGAIIWRYRDHARRRWQLALDRYAEREIALSRRSRVSSLHRQAS